MEKQRLNIFIVDDDQSALEELKHYIDNKFGDGVVVSTFRDGDTCLENISDTTHIVILDFYYLIIEAIKYKNPETEVIMLSSYKDIALAIALFRMRSVHYISEL